MKIAHLSDLHWSYEHLEKCQSSAQFIEAALEERTPDLIVIAGDLQDRMQRLIGNSAVEPMVTHIQGLADIAPVFVIYGNQEHDPSGSLEVLKYIRSSHQIVVESEARNYLFDGEYFYPLEWDMKEPSQGSRGIIIHALPYPTKEWLCRDMPVMSIDELNAKAREQLQKLLAGFAGFRKQYFEHLPSILVGHLNTTRSKLPNGQTLISQDLMVSADDLTLSDADYGALGHIHLNQEVAPKFWYNGSVYNINWGETEQKQFQIVNIKGRAEEPEIEHVRIPSRAMVEVRATWDQDGIHFDNQPETADAEVRCRVRCRKEFAEFVDKEFIRDMFRTAYSVKLEKIVEPEEHTIRSGIQTARSLREKVAEYMRSSGQEASESLLEKADEAARNVR